MPFGDHYAVKLIDLSKIYSTGYIRVEALKNINLHVPRGEFLAIVGPSGSGKSTLLNLIGTLDRPTRGRILIDGVDVSTLDRNQTSRLRNEKIGFIFQAFNLIPRMNAIGNVMLPSVVKGTPSQERTARALQLLNVVGLGDKVTRKPAELSGGEQQRVAIARALMNNPTIVLADEPTGNVDSRTGMEIVQLFRRICEDYGTTTIVVTHNLEVARSCDRIIYLHDGEISKEERLRS